LQSAGWERIYQERGDLQFEVLSKIQKASTVFKEKGYQKILDLGCGTGKHSIFLASEGFQVYATDLSETGVEIARKKADSLGFDNINFRQHDMKEIPFMDDFFDAVICIWTIYHGTLADIEQTLNEIFRVLRSDGTVITDFLSPADYSFGLGREIERNTFIGNKQSEEDVPHHYFTREELIQLFSEYKQVEIRESSRSYQDEKGKRYSREYFDVEAVK